ncbi:MAG: hypothetical protein V2A34_03870, partial [Lentisphaerota bacterium]
LFLSIPYPPAGLWALIVHGNYSLEYARDMMAILMSIPEQEAEGVVLDTLAFWLKTGLLQKE